MQVSRAQLPRFPPTQVPVGIDGLASLAKDIYGCSIDRASLFSYQVAELLELRERNSLLSSGR